MDLSIKQMPSSDRPRERLLKAGPSELTDTELIALVFGGDIAAAGRVVTSVGGARALGRAAIGQLREVDGVGPARACQLKAAFELGARAQDLSPDRAAPLRSPSDARAHFAGLERAEVEELHVLALDARHRLLVRFLAARGSSNVVHVSPRDVLRRLLREGAVAMVIAHNHPTGDPSPSDDDAALTARLRSAAELVGLALLDHLVIASDGFYSFTSGRIFREATPGAAAGAG